MAEAPAKASGAPQGRGACRMCGKKFLPHEVVIVNLKTSEYEHKYSEDCDLDKRREFQITKYLSDILEYQGRGNFYILEILQEKVKTVDEYFGNSMPEETRVLFRKIQLLVFEEWVEVNCKRAVAASLESERSLEKLNEAMKSLANCRSKSQ